MSPKATGERWFGGIELDGLSRSAPPDAGLRG